MNKKQNLKLGAIISYLWVVVHIGVNFLFAPILIKYLGQNEYGLYQVIASFLAYINVLETSVSAGVLRFYCNVKIKNNSTEVENVLAICRRIYRYLSACILIVGGIVIVGFRCFYRSSFTQIEIREGTVMLALLFCNLIITMTNAIYTATIKGNERFVFDNCVSIASQILQPIVCYLIIRVHPYATIVTLIQVCLNLLVAVSRYWYAKKELHVAVKLHHDDKKLAKEILVFASSMLLSNIADQIFLKTDQIILAKMYNTAVVAVYAVGSQIYTNYMYAGITVASVFFPRVSKLYQEENSTQKISQLFIKVGRIAFLMCFLVLSGFVIFGKEFITLWVGSIYEPAYAMAIVVMVPFTIDIIQNLGLTILQVMNRYGFRAKMYFIAACLNIISTLFLAYFLEGFGAALSTGISMFLTSGIILNFYYAKTIGLDIVKFWKNILMIFFKLVPISAIAYIINLMCSTPYKWWILILKIGIYIITFGATTYFMVLNVSEKKMLSTIVDKVMRKRRAYDS